VFRLADILHSLVQVSFSAQLYGWTAHEQAVLFYQGSDFSRSGGFRIAAEAGNRVASLDNRLPKKDKKRKKRRKRLRMPQLSKN